MTVEQQVTNLQVPVVDDDFGREMLSLVVDLYLGRGYSSEQTQIALNRMDKIDNYGNPAPHFLKEEER